MTALAHFPAPDWSPRLPRITVDVRAYLAAVVEAQSSTRAARFDAAGDLSVMAPRDGGASWFDDARAWDWLCEGDEE